MVVSDPNAVDNEDEDSVINKSDGDFNAEDE
jgi:hypothetical protein